MLDRSHVLCSPEFSLLPFIAKRTTEMFLKMLAGNLTNPTSTCQTQVLNKTHAHTQYAVSMVQIVCRVQSLSGCVFFFKCVKQEDRSDPLPLFLSGSHLLTR